MGGRLKVGIGLAVGLAAAWLWLGRGGSSSPPSGAAGARPAAEAPAALPGELTALGAQLAAERAAREALALEVEALRAEVRRLSGAGAPVEAPPRESAAVSPALEPPPGPALPLAAPAFDEQSLVDAGFDPREAARLREATEQLELEQLYLRDRAVREGWAGTPRFAEEARALDARGRALREELGDDRYDWLLFASGRPNRVIVQSVMERSPAGDAGLLAGDAILSYGGTRLFDVSALRDATTGGRPGESVPVDVARGGERIRLYVPRGPLGVRLEELRQRPAS